jgi:hypothetical protein
MGPASTVISIGTPDFSEWMWEIAVAQELQLQRKGRRVSNRSLLE